MSTDLTEDQWGEIPLQEPIGGFNITYHSGTHSMMVYFTIPYEVDGVRIEDVPDDHWGSLKNRVGDIENSIRHVIEEKK